MAGCSGRSRPGTRWWWLGSAVDEKNLTYNLEEYARAGMGAVEITPIYGVQGNDANDIQFLSPRWMEVLKHTQAEGKRTGIEIDMNTGTVALRRTGSQHRRRGKQSHLPDL